jgi:hypothetical protein
VIKKKSQTYNSKRHKKKSENKKNKIRQSLKS